MIYTPKALDKSIEDTRSMAAHDRTNGNPTRATYEEGFADGQASLCQTIEAQEKRIAELKAALESLQYYVGNPSAWESYDEDMGERIRRACEVAEPKFWMKSKEG